MTDGSPHILQPPSSMPELAADQGLEDLGQIIGVYNEVTSKLQRSHEALTAEVVRLQDQLASTDAQLQRSKRLAALGEMAAGIAHEIRNPLAAIQLYAKMLADDLGQIAATESGTTGSIAVAALSEAEKIRSAVHGLNAIVCDVLTFSREMSPQPTVIEAADFLRSVLDAHAPAIEAANIQVALNLADHHLQLQADPDLLRQAILNLVRNAVDAMDHGCGTLTLEVSRQDNRVLIRVLDTGPGIGPDEIDRIFNPYFTTRNTGTGLGLAIVHRIVDAHGGAIAVHNEKGAVFTLSLPDQSEVVTPECSQ